jgi:hypothetical protein
MPGRYFDQTTKTSNKNPSLFMIRPSSQHSTLQSLDTNGVAAQPTNRDNEAFLGIFLDDLRKTKENFYQNSGV